MIKLKTLKSIKPFKLWDLSKMTYKIILEYLPRFLWMMKMIKEVFSCGPFFSIEIVLMNRVKRKCPLKVNFLDLKLTKPHEGPMLEPL
jgi:hypothetical protein